MQRWLLRGKEEEGITNEANLHHFSVPRLDRLNRLLITIVLICLAIVPISVIFLTELPRGANVGVVGGFTAVVMILIALFIEVSAQEIFLGMAA